VWVVLSTPGKSIILDGDRKLHAQITPSKELLNGGEALAKEACSYPGDVTVVDKASLTATSVQQDGPDTGREEIPVDVAVEAEQEMTKNLSIAAFEDSGALAGRKIDVTLYARGDHDPPVSIMLS
jgi:hypothetical protein